MKNFNVKGVKTLSKVEQKSIAAGRFNLPSFTCREERCERIPSPFIVIIHCKYVEVPCQ